MNPRVRAITGLSILLGLLLVAPAAFAQDQVSSEAATMNAVIKAIRQSLIEAQTNNVRGFPALTKATVSLNTLTSKEGGVVFKFFVFTIGAKKGIEETSTLTIEMAPPPTVDAGTTASVDPQKVKEALSQAINSAKQTVTEVNRDIGSGEAKLRTTKIEIELKFAVKKSGSAGAEVEILPIGVEGTGDLKRSQIHSLKLVFGT